MKHIIQFSGGAASAYVAYLVAQEYKENTILLFHDTKAEHPDAARFRQQVSEYIGIPITEVSDGRSIWDLIKQQRCLPSSFIPFCTRILKAEPGEKYLRELTGGYTLYNGFGPDEWKRVQRATVRAETMGRVVKSPLFERNITNQQVKDIIRNEWKICLPEPYLYLSHNNCIPCWKAGKGHFYKVWEHYPEQFQKAIEMEELTGHTMFKDKSLAELAKEWESSRNLEFPFEESIPCMCAG